MLDGETRHVVKLDPRGRVLYDVGGYGSDETSLELPADTIVVCAYGLLIPPELLARALWLNVHPSLLPRWRGAAPVERAIMAGDAETGVTIHQTVEALDAGPIAAQESFAIDAEDDAGAVFARARGPLRVRPDPASERDPPPRPRIS